MRKISCEGFPTCYYNELGCTAGGLHEHCSWVGSCSIPLRWDINHPLPLLICSPFKQCSWMLSQITIIPFSITALQIQWFSSFDFSLCAHKNKVKLGVTCLDHLHKQPKLLHASFFFLITYYVINKSCQPQDIQNYLGQGALVSYHVPLHCKHD